MREDFEDFYAKDNEDAKEDASQTEGTSKEYGPKINFKFSERPSGGGKKRFTALLVAVPLLFSLLCGVGGMLIGQNLSGGDRAPIQGGASDSSDIKHNIIMQESNSSATALDGSVTGMIEKCAECVVEIITTPYNSAISTKSGAGSGVIIAEDEDGSGTYIVTNNHVVEGSFTVITVRTVDGKEYTAEIVGSDWQSDVAVLRIKAKGLAKATWAKSESLALGQSVFAIGNPLGALGGSVSRGIISGVERTISVDGVPMKLLQIDAAINPGNSGGGLFDLNGNLVGIVNAKSVATDVEGIGFAIPADYAKEMVTELCEKGYVSDRVDLGFRFSGAVSIFPYTGMGILSYAYSEEVGGVIGANDVLLTLEVGGKKVEISSISAYRSVLVRLKAGDTVKAGIVGDKYYEVTLTAHKVKG